MQNNILACIDGTHVEIDPQTHRKDDYICRQFVTNKKKLLIFLSDTPDLGMTVGFTKILPYFKIWISVFFIFIYFLIINFTDFYLLGDSAYPCLKNLMTPYKDNGRLTHEHSTTT